MWLTQTYVLTTTNEESKQKQERGPVGAEMSQQRQVMCSRLAEQQCLLKLSSVIVYFLF